MDHNEDQSTQDVYEGIIAEIKQEHNSWKHRILYGVLALLTAIIITLLAWPAKIHTVEVSYFLDDRGILQRFVPVEDSGVNQEEKYVREDINKYVLYHETYGPSLMSDQAQVQRFSTPEVFQQYLAGTKPIYDKVGKSMRATITVDNIIINSNSIATVQFTKAVRSNTGELRSTSWTVTITYEYFNYDFAKSKNPFESGVSTTESDMNPDGFTVTSWRMDSDLSRESGL